MNSPWCQSIIESIKDDSKWKASIHFPSTVWQETDLITNKDDNSSSGNEESNNHSTKPPEAFEKLFNTSTISSKVKQIDIIKLFDCNDITQKKFQLMLVQALG
jgi:hypothetical protein